MFVKVAVVIFPELTGRINPAPRSNGHCELADGIVLMRTVNDAIHVRKP
jgi:hypothetical protein